ncbi:MAG: hypothetical protein LBQ12_15780 [Deltaproteobacteria bacterium]|jgi:hypothetical protein|nr:hypothetical protein [Deltaproteobacteria bacterium]
MNRAVPRPSAVPAPAASSPLAASASLAAALALALALASLAPSPLSAQDDPYTEAFRGQAHITEADVPAALELIRAMREDASAEEVAAVGLRYGYDEARVAFVATKFSTGLMMLAEDNPLSREEVAAMTGSPLGVPTPAELEVIRGALPQIKAGWGIN